MANNILVYGFDEKTFSAIKKSMRDCDTQFMDCTSCFTFCGKASGNPIFYDTTHAEYITKMSDGYARHKNLPSLQKPIIVNGVNVVNICQENGKIGTIDEINKKIIKPRWNEIKVELKVTYHGSDE